MQLNPEFKSKVQFLKDNLKKEFLRVVSFRIKKINGYLSFSCKIALWLNPKGQALKIHFS